MLYSFAKWAYAKSHDYPRLRRVAYALARRILPILRRGCAIGVGAVSAFRQQKQRTLASLRTPAMVAADVRLSPNPFPALSDPNFFVQLESHFPDHCRALRASADQNLAGYYRVFSENWVQLGRLPNWQLDHFSGLALFENEPSYDLMAKPRPRGYDLKVPWEASRAHHLPQLALAALHAPSSTSELELIRDQIQHFIATNPPAYGVNWICTMDVSIRLVNWLVAVRIGLLHPLSSQVFSDSFLVAYAQHVETHLKHILQNLERGPILRSNHYLANVVGLFFGGVMAPFAPSAAAALSHARTNFPKEAKSQVQLDGTDFEASSGYHRMVLEFLNYCIYLSDFIRAEVPATVRARVQQMFGFAEACSFSDFSDILWGDQDSGHLLEFFPTHPSDTRAALALNPAHARLHPISLIVGGFQAAEKQEKADSPTLALKRFPNSGVYQVKSPRSTLWFFCGPVGQLGNGGHSHNDKLSFILEWENIPLFIDPGTFVYTPFPELRNEFRSTGSHNTVSLSQLEQNDFSNELFSLRDIAKARVLKAELTESADGAKAVVEGCHFGFKRGPKGLAHQRKVSFSSEQGKDKISISDRFGRKPLPNRLLPKHANFCQHPMQSAIWVLYLHPDVKVGAVGEGKLRFDHPSCVLNFPPELKHEIVEAEWAPRYRQKKTTHKILFHGQIDASANITFELRT